MINNKASHISQHGHVSKLYSGPAPAFGFAVYYGYRACALHGKGIKHHERKCYGKSKYRLTGLRVFGLVHFLLYRLYIIGIAVYAINCGHGAYKNFAGRK